MSAESDRQMWDRIGGTPLVPVGLNVYNALIQAHHGLRPKSNEDVSTAGYPNIVLLVASRGQQRAFAHIIITPNAPDHAREGIT